MKYLITVVFLCLFVLQTESWNDGGSVLLREVQVLTLYQGRNTNSRRTSPIPQLQCVGGSAGCSSFVPDVVQCQNKGWDGIDVQWECKTDMDDAYRFGRIEVSCEGFNHPDDPYILKGSCGMEYTLELTEQGQQRGRGGGWGWVWRRIRLQLLPGLVRLPEEPSGRGTRTARAPREAMWPETLVA
ncbi:hypothetical protein SKAU_G00031280 [Synaphobranchus kaupii]|uniref:Store-operated calcium entry-associated regulatory factor n=1 Tax=Synaphobranchus kaupii TaxID=118154 RepID=A0A9Q1JF48_SYNKA|nr:hypothetical protein SKAU_G00031280 [Synaphobranchus kaupii]